MTMGELITSIIVAVITSGCTLVGVIITSKKQHDSTLEQVKTEIKLIQKDIVNLEKKQDKHNTLIERMYAVEKSVDLLETRVKSNEADIAGLESKKSSK